MHQWTTQSAHATSTHYILWYCYLRDHGLYGLGYKGKFVSLYQGSWGTMVDHRVPWSAFVDHRRSWVPWGIIGNHGYHKGPMGTIGSRLQEYKVDYRWPWGTIQKAMGTMLDQRGPWCTMVDYRIWGPGCLDLVCQLLLAHLESF